MGEIDELINTFPGLSDDPLFRISSRKNINYNCISWAFGFYDDRWMQHDTRPRFDGVWYWWPKDVAMTPDVSSYIEAFRTKGFELCSNFDLEEDYVKVALFVYNGTTICSHASRQKFNGVWISKLGREQDIEHGSPFIIEGEAYGTVHCFMKNKK